MKKRIKITALASVLTVAIISGTAIVPVFAADDNSKEDIEISFDIPEYDEYHVCKTNRGIYFTETCPWCDEETTVHYCGTCDQKFDTQEALKAHRNGTKETFKCDKCGDEFDTEEALKAHKANSKDCGIGITFPIPDAKETFKCDKCGDEFDTEEELKEHKENSKDCGIGITFPIPDEKETFKCDKCGDEFDTEEALKEHKSNSKEEIEWDVDDLYCHNCGEFVMGYHQCKNNYFAVESGDPNSKEDIEIEFPIPDTKETFKCDKCGDKFDTEEALKAHKSNSKDCGIGITFQINNNAEKIAILETEVLEAENLASEARAEADRLEAIATEKRAELEG